MTDGIMNSSAPVRIGWGVGLLTLVPVIFIPVFLGAGWWWLSGNPGAGASAMFGSFVACWIAYLGLIRLGVRRGWWQ